MTCTDGDRDDRPTETAMDQFRLLRHAERPNVLNHTKVRRMARDAGLSELADAVDEGRYYDLVARYRAEYGSDDESADGG